MSETNFQNRFGSKYGNQILAEKTVCILLVGGETPEGVPVYAYVAVRADKLEEFMKAQSTGVFYPQEYGVIIVANEGEPDADVKKMMQDEYGFNHEEMVGILSPDKAAEIVSNLSFDNDN